MKISYSCMKNIKTVINLHNSKILSQDSKTDDLECNCSKKHLCPMVNENNSCRAKDVIYQATVYSAGGKRFYIGLTAMEIKKRIAKHKTDFRNRKYEKNTELSKHIWNLKDNNEPYDITWKIISRTKSLRNGDKVCQLCIREATLILQAGDQHLNRRKEIASTCRHRKKYLLINTKDDGT